jgi:hypothetical protein
MARTDQRQRVIDADGTDRDEAGGNDAADDEDDLRVCPALFRVCCGGQSVAGSGPIATVGAGGRRGLADQGAGVSLR